VKKQFSIITICYNEGNRIEKTLQSIFSQTFLDYESIVIDGGSTDGTVDIIKKYLDRITYFVSEKDNGRYDAMNKGIMVSNGEYLLFLNGGDYFASKTVLQDVVNFRLDTPIIYGNIITRKGNIDKIKNTNRIIGKPFAFYKKTFPHPGTFIKKGLFDQYGLYNTTYTISSDNDFFKRVIINNVKCKHIPVIISVFYKDGISCSPLTKEIQKKENRQIQIHNYGFFRCILYDIIYSLFELIKSIDRYGRKFLRRYIIKINAKNRKL